ncbi:MAG: AAA family ATPase [Candidatus Competibacteraceae bacterium]
MLEGKGDIGQSLFAAAAGLADLRQLSGKLEVEASDLFNPRGKKSEIQVALKELEEQRKRAREATVRSSAWEQTERTKRQAEKKHAELRAELNRWREEQRRLSRIIAHLPLAAERSAKLQELPRWPRFLLPPEAGQQRIETEERLRAAADNQREARAALEELRRQRAQLVVREALLSHAGAIERLHHAANDYRGTLNACPASKRISMPRARLLASLPRSIRRWRRISRPPNCRSDSAGACTHGAGAGTGAAGGMRQTVGPERATGRTGARADRHAPTAAG